MPSEGECAVDQSRLLPAKLAGADAPAGVGGAGISGRGGRGWRAGLLPAYQHDGYRCDARHLLGIAAQQQPVHAAAAVGSQHHEVAAAGLGLLRNQFRHALALALQPDRFDLRTVPAQFRRGFVQQGLAGRQDLRAHLLDVDHGALEAEAVLHLLDDVEQHDGRAAHAGQPGRMVQRQARRGAAVEWNQDA